MFFGKVMVSKGSKMLSKNGTIDIYTILRDEIEKYNYYQQIIKIFPHSLIDRPQVVNILLAVHKMENCEEKSLDLPKLTNPNIVAAFEDMLKIINPHINARLIVAKIRQCTDQYHKLPEVVMPPEVIKMHPNIDQSEYIVILDFNFMNFTLNVPRQFISLIQSKMGKSIYLSKVVFLYALRINLLYDFDMILRRPSFWGVFPDLDYIADYFSYKKRRVT